MRVTFTLHMQPVPKARPRFTKTGRTYTPKTTAEYEHLVADTYRACAKIAGAEITDRPVLLSIVARYAIPQSARRKRLPDKLHSGDPCTARPDIDNIVKAVLDGLNGVAYKDDAQVYGLYSQKVYAESSSVTVSVEWEEA